MKRKIETGDDNQALTLGDETNVSENEIYFTDINLIA